MGVPPSDKVTSNPSIGRRRMNSSFSYDYTKNPALRMMTNKIKRTKTKAAERPYPYPSTPLTTITSSVLIYYNMLKLTFVMGISLNSFAHILYHDTSEVYDKHQ
jgi:hypothetical protein